MLCTLFLFFSTLLFSQSSYNLYSPYLELPAIGEDETMHYGFWIHADMPDSDGNNDDYLDDYYNIAIYDIGTLAWHSSNLNSLSGNNFWCSEEEIGGYRNGWMQYLDTPTVSIGDNAELSVSLFYVIEDAVGPFVDGSCADGWDAANIRISVDDGISWELLTGSIPYDFDCGYGWIWNDVEYEVAGSLNHLASGWGGSSNGWVNFSSDLSDYLGEDVIIRFAFGSDPAWSTVDDHSLTGFQIDDIIIEDDTGILFTDLGNDVSQVVVSGEVWIDQFYDYGSVIDGRPGADDWEWYYYNPNIPTLSFNGNIFMDISDFSEKTIQFRIQSRYDNNHDGGQGGGLFIDDFMIYKLSSGVYFAPWDLIADPGDSEVQLSWYDMNVSGVKDFVYDNNDFDINIETDGWAGELFDIVGPAQINSFSIFNNYDQDTTISIAIYGMFGSTIDTEPTYTMEVALNNSLDWNNFDVSDSSWTIENYFVIAHEISSDFGAAFDIDTTSISLRSYVRFGEGSWDLIGLYEMDEIQLVGDFGIRANISYEGAGVTYNVYRNDSLIFSELGVNNYIDTGLTNNTTYEYALTATYSDGEESGESNTVSVTPFANTVHEEGYDDGSFESEFNAGSGNFSAVRFSGASMGEDIVRFKWFQNGSGGAFYIKVFEDDGGMPGAEIYSAVQASGNVDGWNEKDLSSQGLNVSGDFWVGTKEFSSSAPFGLDTSGDSGNSYQRVGSSGDWTAVNGNLAYHVYLDCGDNCSGRRGEVVLNWDEIEKLSEVSQPIYSLQWKNKKLSKVPIQLNRRQVYRSFIQSDILNRANVISDTLFVLGVYDFEDENTGEWNNDTGWNLTANDFYSPNHSFNSPNDSLNGLSSVEYTLLPQKHVINRIFPNPFNPIANIQLTISEFANIRLVIYDLNGRIINTLIDQMMNPGSYTISWNGENSHGSPAVSGIYFSVLEYDNKNLQSRKLVLIK